MKTQQVVVCAGCQRPLAIKSEDESTPTAPAYCRQCRLLRKIGQNNPNTTVDENQIVAWLMAGQRKRA